MADYFSMLPSYLHTYNAIQFDFDILHNTGDH